jgi:hypothetical protein
MGEPLGEGKEDGEERGGGGGQYTSNLGPEWMGIAPQPKGGIPSTVSKRGSRTGEGSSRQRVIIKGIVHVPPI